MKTVTSAAVSSVNWTTVPLEFPTVVKDSELMLKLLSVAPVTWTAESGRHGKWEMENRKKNAIKFARNGRPGGLIPISHLPFAMKFAFLPGLGPCTHAV